MRLRPAWAVYSQFLTEKERGGGEGREGGKEEKKVMNELGRANTAEQFHGNPAVEVLHCLMATSMCGVKQSTRDDSQCQCQF